jgi:hypothetical protein
VLLRVLECTSEMMSEVAEERGEKLLRSKALDWCLRSFGFGSIGFC